MDNNIKSNATFKKKSIKAGEMIKLFIYKYSIVHMILLFLIGIELILNANGYSINKNIFYRSKENPVTILPWMYMYYILISPFLEEFFFRELLLNGLRKYGLRFAIITQALIFGFLHKNIISIVHVTASGILYGYIASMTNSILPTVALHIMHNLFSILIGVTILKDADLTSSIQIVMAITYILIGIIILYKSNWKIKLADKINIDVKKVFARKQSS